ncbi:Arylsulfatase [Planctomycetes bacterium Pan216]|uniref:Arylsulfatase n=1 Tax=Kolteria novifilia TaxID=2527975 RepID=A0A518B836_9BACT|nr:Arylsulfatase [Planctomycetes bacterium Pan216]
MGDSIISHVMLALLATTVMQQQTDNSATNQDEPNVVIIFTDDLGYGDLGCYGHPTIATPNLDQMAAQGMKFTDFYSACSVCTPSRAALMTGRLPIRNGMWGNRRVLFPNSPGGLQQSEVTIARALKQVGYETLCVGKWHLGHHPEYLPTSHGFDQYFGIPYSNDMEVEKRGDPPLPLMENETVLEAPVDQTTLTKRYTEKVVSYIKEKKDDSFFIYYAQTFPHVPLYASKDFKGKSRRGLYGDVVEEIDWSVGKILDTLRQEGLAEKTLVFFTSDNGPWLIKMLEGGSAGLLREGKGCTYEGGMRVPALAWWPGTVKAGSVNHELASTLDLLPTVAELTGAKLPQDRSYDGFSMVPMLEGTGPSKRDHMFFYRRNELYAVRLGDHKAHYITQGAYGKTARKLERHDPPQLYHLGHDPSEQHDISAKNPEILSRIDQLVKDHQASLDPPPSQLDRKAEKPKS